MGVPFAKIEELIEIAKECDRKLPEDEKKIHVLDIAATLQKLIDDEMAELDKMAQAFLEEEEYKRDMSKYEDDMNAVSSEYERVKQERKMEDWPHGL